MTVIINPGSGPVEGGTAEQAWENLQVLLRDVTERYPDVDTLTDSTAEQEDGRWVYSVRVTKGEQVAVMDVEMPGLPLERVRWMRGEGQDIWDSPRLYVDGSSWVWWFAIAALGSYPFDDDED